MEKLQPVPAKPRGLVPCEVCGGRLFINGRCMRCAGKIITPFNGK